MTLTNVLDTVKKMEEETRDYNRELYLVTEVTTI